MEEIAKAIWFQFIAGVASILGTLLALYQLRVKNLPHSKFRRMEWEKILLISFGIGLSTFSGVRFYAQFPPPRFIPFREVYDFIHGTEGSYWTEGPYLFNAIFQKSGQTIVIHKILLTRNTTRVYFQAKSQHETSISKFFDPFPDPVIGTTKGIQYNLLDKYNTSVSGVIVGYVDFPSLSGMFGDILIWNDQRGLKEISRENATKIFTNDLRGDGTLIWGLLFIIGITVLGIGIWYNPFNLLKRKFLEEGKELQEEQDRALEKILRGRTYEELSFTEKQKYDQTYKLYETTLKEISKMLTGDSSKTSKEYE